MRRALWRAGCVAILGLGLSGPGTGQDAPPRHGFRSQIRPVTRKGPVGMGVAAARRLQRAEGARRGAQVDPAPGAAAVHAPLPVPEMPVVGAHEPAPDWLADEPQMAEDPAPALAKSFPALGDNNASIPPDTHGAVGYSEVMTVLNTQVRVQDRDGNDLQTELLSDFWSGIATASVFDPRVHFDPDPAYGGRWIWAAVQGARSAASGLLDRGVGRPRGPPRRRHDHRRRGPARRRPDRHRLGRLPQRRLQQEVDRGPGQHVPGLRQLLRQHRHLRLRQGGVLRRDGHVWSTSSPAASTARSRSPRPPTTSPSRTSTCSSGGTRVPGVLRLYRLSGAVGSELLLDVGFPAAPPWGDSAPDVAAPPGADDFAPQMPGPPGCTACLAPPCKIQTNDSRIQNVVYRAGKLWAAHTVFLPEAAPTRSSVQWWEIDPADGSRLQGGLVDDPGGQWFYAFPSLAVNRHGDVLRGLLGLRRPVVRPGPATPSATPSTPPGPCRPDEVLKDGVSCYFKDLATGRNRWGDYSATVVDPADDTGLWTIQEYAETPDSGDPVPALRDKWGTWWGMLDPTRSISIDDVAVVEGDSGTTNLTFTVTLSEPSIDTVTVEWSTADDTATVADSDYVAVSAAGSPSPRRQTSKPTTVLVNGDLKYELDETLFVNLANPDGRGPGRRPGEGRHHSTTTRRRRGSPSATWSRSRATGAWAPPPSPSR